METSAKASINVEEAFFTLARDIKVNMEKRLEAQNPPRPSGGFQPGRDDGGRGKNIMAWLSRCSILWLVNGENWALIGPALVIHWNMQKQI